MCVYFAEEPPDNKKYIEIWSDLKWISLYFLFEFKQPLDIWEWRNAQDKTENI